MKTVTPWSLVKAPLRVIESAPGLTPLTTSIVPTAAAILREELQSLVPGGVSRLSPVLGGVGLPGQPAALPGGQLHSLVDALSRVLNLPSGQLMQLITQTGATGIEPDDAGAFESVRVLRTPRPSAAGDVARLSLQVENDDAEPDECTLGVTDLVGPSSARIPASHVRVSPQPAHIPGRGSVDIQIEVRIPSGTPAGFYTGLLQTDDGDALRALVQVHVGR